MAWRDGPAATEASEDEEPADEAVDTSSATRGLILAGAASVAAGFAVARLVEANAEGKLVGLLLSAVVVMSAYTAVTRPQLFPAMAMAYIPFSKAYPYPILGLPGLNGSNLLLAFGLLSYLITWSRRPIRPALLGIEWGLVTYLGFGLVGLGITVANLGGISLVDIGVAYRSWATPFLYFFLTRAVVEERRDARGLLLLIGWVAFLAGVLTWYEGIDLRDRRGMEEQRAGGIMGQPNTMGAFLGYYGVPLLALVVSRRGWFQRGLAASAFLVVARSVLFTYSRGSQLALVAGSAAVIGLWSPLAFAVVGTVGLGARNAPGLLPESVRSRFAQTAETDVEIYDDSLETRLDKSSATRLNLWHGGLAIMERHPVAGVGLFNFPYVVERYTPVELTEDDPRDAHNAFILVGAELGLPALALLVVLLSWVGAAAVGSYYHGDVQTERMVALACFGSLAAVVVSCMFGSRLSDEALVGGFWSLAGALFALRSIRSQEEEDADMRGRDRERRP